MPNRVPRKLKKKLKKNKFTWSDVIIKLPDGCTITPITIKYLDNGKTK